MEIGELGNLRPPRLEDAGFEDCALPPDAIHEAFLRAADAVRSRAADCVKIPSPPGGGDSIDPYSRPCSGEKCDLTEKSCADGLRGLEIGEKKHGGDDEDDEKKPKLVEDVCESLKN